MPKYFKPRKLSRRDKILLESCMTPSFPSTKILIYNIIKNTQENKRKRNIDYFKTIQCYFLFFISKI